MQTYENTVYTYGSQAMRLLRPLFTLVAVVWLIEVVDWVFFNNSLDHLGILPRQMDGLRGILLAPFLHGGFSHLMANTLPFLILGFLVMLRHRSRILIISALILLISGFGTWLIAPANTVHIGASGLIFGYFAFLIVNAWYERSARAIVLAILVTIVYGGLLAGVLPSGSGISWQGHIFGLIGGGLAAFYFSPRGKV
jgi:membrane associated rhomboid family serine protease